MLDIIMANLALWMDGWMDKQRQKNDTIMYFLAIYGQYEKDLKPYLFCLKHWFVRLVTKQF